MCHRLQPRGMGVPRTEADGVACPSGLVQPIGVGLGWVRQVFHRRNVTVYPIKQALSPARRPPLAPLRGATARQRCGLCARAAAACRKVGLLPTMGRCDQEEGVCGCQGGLERLYPSTAGLGACPLQCAWPALLPDAWVTAFLWR